MINYGKKNTSLDKFNINSNVRDGEGKDTAVKGKINYGAKSVPLGKFDSKVAAAAGLSAGPNHTKNAPNAGQKTSKLNKFGY